MGLFGNSGGEVLRRRFGPRFHFVFCTIFCMAAGVLSFTLPVLPPSQLPAACVCLLFLCVYWFSVLFSFIDNAATARVPVDVCVE